MIKLGLVDANKLPRDHCENFFKDSPEFEVLFAVGDLKSLYHINSTLQPDIILLDIMFPSGNSLESIHKIKQLFPYAHVVILSALDDVDTVHTAFNNGAKGYLLKTSSRGFIKDALIKTQEGGTPLSPLIANYLLDFKSHHTLAEAAPELTKREVTLCNLVAKGMSNKMIAATMNITFLTVNQHLKHIYKKLNINSKTELVAYIMKL